MNEEDISAATIDDLDLSGIELSNPAVAMELRRLGALLESPNGTDADLICLCELLLSTGFKEKAEDLLRCNTLETDDAIHHAYIRMFGRSAEERFCAERSAFERQFGVRLELEKLLTPFRMECKTTPLSTQKDVVVDTAIHRYLRHPCIVLFDFDPSSGSTADIGCENDDVYFEYLVLVCHDMVWSKSLAV